MRIRFERRELAAIAVGGLLGATLRWWITDVDVRSDGGWFEYAPNDTMAVIGEPAVAWRTLIVNLVGTATLGLILALRAAWPDRRLTGLGLATGFCGSLTTLSTLAVELATRFRAGTGSGDAGITIGTGIDGFTPAGDQAVAIAYSPGGLTPVAAGLAYLLVSLVGGVICFVGGRMAGRAATRRQGS